MRGGNGLWCQIIWIVLLPTGCPSRMVMSQPHLMHTGESTVKLNGSASLRPETHAVLKRIISSLAPDDELLILCSEHNQCDMLSSLASEAMLSVISFVVPGYSLWSLFDDILESTKDIDTVLVKTSETVANTILTQANGYDRFGKWNWYLSYIYKWLFILDDVQDTTHLSVSTGRILHMSVINIMSNQCSLRDRIALYSMAHSTVNHTLQRRYDDLQALMMDHQSFRLFPNLKYHFSQQHLTVAYNKWPGFIAEKYLPNGNMTLVGYSVNMLKSLALRLNFTYTLVMPADLKWGGKTNGSWNGVVGQVVRKEVDFSIAPLSITYARRQAMDFSDIAYYFYHYTVLIKRPDDDSKAIFIKPFKYQVWIGIGVTGIVAGLWLALLLNCNVERRRNSRIGNVISAIWCTYGCMLYQGHVPRTRKASARVVIGFLWLFSIIMTAIYTGNLVAFISVSRPVLPFRTIEEMVEQTTYRYGTLGGTAFVASLQTSTSRPLRIIQANLMKFQEDDPEIMSIDHNVHLEKVLREDYAYLVDNAAVEYLKENCSYTVIPDKFPQLSPTALGFTKHSALEKPFTEVVLKLDSTGMLNKWRKEFWPGNADKCSPKRINTVQFTVEHLYGVVKIMFAMIAAATVALFVEMLWLNIKTSAWK